jgi:hypothetical protein
MLHTIGNAGSGGPPATSYSLLRPLSVIELAMMVLGPASRHGFLLAVAGTKASAVVDPRAREASTRSRQKWTRGYKTIEGCNE